MTPSKYQSIKLGDLLTDAQIRGCTRILKHKQSPDKTIEELKKYLGHFRTELEAKGVDSDYLSYMLIFLITQEQ